MKSKISAGFIATTFLVVLLFPGGVAFSQSGRGSMHGYVAFDTVAYNDLAKENVHAKVELRCTSEGDHRVYSAETNNYGAYDFKVIPMGEYVLRISAPGFKAYQTEIYIPSDFTCSLATMLKKGFTPQG